MKVLSIEASMLTLLGFASRTGGQLYMPTALQSFLDRYRFLKYPENLLGMDSQKLEFSHGQFEGMAIERFEVYPDGVIVQSHSNASVLDRFANDVIEFINSEWGASFIQSNTINRMYQSTLIIESDKNILAPLSSASLLANGLQRRLAGTTGLDIKFDPFGIAMCPDQATLGSMRPSVFRIERRAGVEYKFNQYFSVAPLKTDDHTLLLTEWENSI